MRLYNYVFKKVSTGRANKGVRYAMSENGLRRALGFDVDVGEILAVEEVPVPAASEAQLRFLQSLISSVPSGMSWIEASDMIDNAKENRRPGDDRDRLLAERFGVAFSRFTSKAKIFNQVTWQVRREKQPRDLVLWYIYRVYRDGFDRTGMVGMDSPDDPALIAIAATVLQDAELVAAIISDAEMAMVGLRWFGDIVLPDGQIADGEDDDTVAYRRISGMLQAIGLIEPKKRDHRMIVRGRRESSVENQSGRKRPVEGWDDKYSNQRKEVDDRSRGKPMAALPTVIVLFAVIFLLYFISMK